MVSFGVIKKVMYRVSVESAAVVNFSHELKVIREMMNLVYRSFLNFANSLCSFEKRISSYQANHGYNWIDGGARREVTSDFYSYVKTSQRRITDELAELNVEFAQCKKQAEGLIFNIGECGESIYRVSNAPVVNTGNVIPFSKQVDPDEAVVSNLSDLLRESEQLSRVIHEKHKNVSDKAANLVTQMRGQLQA